MGDVKKTHCIYTYRTSWPTCDNVVMSLWDAIYPDTYIPTQIGIVELRIANVGDHKGVGYIWNLQIHESYRGIGLGKILLREIINYAKMNGCKAVTLDWSIDEAPRWVFDWYVRQGFDEKEFGRDCAFMEKKLNEQTKGGNPMKPHIEISKQLQDLYGPNRIVIGKAGEKIYFDLPDDPEVFAHLIKRMFQALAVRDMGDHLSALAQQMEEMISPTADA